MTTPTDTSWLPPLRRREWIAAALAGLAGCGGGVDSGGTGTGHDVTLAVGAISGFGSIIVNGVRFDDARATIDDDDGQARQRDELRLGMRVELSASAVVTQGGIASATASAIRIRSEIGGPIESIDTVAGRLVVLGQRVDLVATTVVEGGAAALTVGQVVWIGATLDLPGARYVAAHIEPRDGVTAYKLRGRIDALDLAGGTLDIGALRVRWSALAPPDPATALAPGRFVSLRLATAPQAGVWSAVDLDVMPSPPRDRESAEVEGRITAWTSASSFVVDGLPVDASSATFPDGSAGVVLGAKVEVSGPIAGGVLRASRVGLEDDDGGDEAFELHGRIESVDSAARRFVVRGTTVQWSAATRFDSSTPEDIVVGREVEVRGRLGADEQTIDATLVHVED